MEADGDLIGGRGGDSGAAFGERDPIIGQAAPGHDAGWGMGGDRRESRTESPDGTSALGKTGIRRSNMRDKQLTEAAKSHKWTRPVRSHRRYWRRRRGRFVVTPISRGGPEALEKGSIDLDAAVDVAVPAVTRVNPRISKVVLDLLPGGRPPANITQRVCAGHGEAEDGLGKKREWGWGGCGARAAGRPGHSE
ncbi:hypothetical protein C8F04DRAFT_1179394 [Mycena alexandri]|uniref:Uncharacterized protein n=1 Tax=Mycena alexandri TaxID=1745969 RepID=A0AAD6T3N8_9AGAR|nr:hypothetical protein C8F04DRAFT_1179394 [Mycena alexandri]